MAAVLTKPSAQQTETEEELSVMGVGGKIAIPVLLYMLAAGALSRSFHPTFRITRKPRALRAAGIGMIATGFSLNLAAAFAMLKANKENRLATTGLYRLFRDPMYTLMIFITLPGLFLLFNSWLMLPGVIPAYLAHRVFVKEEHRYLEEMYGDAYREYVKGVLLKI